MKRLGLGLLAAGIVVLAVAYAQQVNPPAGAPAIAIKTEERNPFTSLDVNTSGFQFAIVSDRTGGQRAKVFSQAVERLNLLQPEFVMSVGDLIQGYKDDPAKVNAEWREFQSYIGKLKMPFFYVVGNHDYTNPAMAAIWKEKFGRHYYHFVYRDVLFVCLNTDDKTEKTLGNNHGNIDKEQQDYLKKTLDENPKVAWTLVFVHKPMWTAPNLDKNGWLEVEKHLAGRKYTVFAGHVHRYQKFVRNGMNYYQLATTGGGSKLRGVEWGEFDHIVWVTMKPDGPILANIMLDGILAEDLSRPDSDEPGIKPTNRKPVFPAKGKVHLDGCPVAGAYVVFQLADKDLKPQIRADALTEADGTYTLSTYEAYDGLPEGEWIATVVQRKPLFGGPGVQGKNLLPAKYEKIETSDLKFKSKPEANEFNLELKK